MGLFMRTVTTTPDGLVHIEFEKSNEETKLVDAIVVSPEQYAQWTEADIEAIEEQRWLNYLEAIKPQPEPEGEDGVTDVEFVEGE
jgi:hypothetical protein